MYNIGAAQLNLFRFISAYFARFDIYSETCYNIMHKAYIGEGMEEQDRNISLVAEEEAHNGLCISCGAPVGEPHSFWCGHPEYY